MNVGNWRRHEDQHMEYLKVEWVHSNDQYPTLLYSELDEDRMEVRKVERYQDGRVGFADHKQNSGDTQLGIEPLPSLEEIAADRIGVRLSFYTLRSRRTLPYYDRTLAADRFSGRRLPDRLPRGHQRVGREQRPAPSP